METGQTTYSIKQVSELTGLTAPTLRYYESVGVSPAITRDESSGHRVYSEDDVELLGWIACLAATGMGIAEMRQYVANGKDYIHKAALQIELLQKHDAVLEADLKRLSLRRDYLALKIRYWQAVEASDKELAGHLAQEAISLAQQFR